ALARSGGTTCPPPATTAPSIHAAVLGRVAIRGVVGSLIAAGPYRSRRPRPVPDVTEAGGLRTLAPWTTLLRPAPRRPPTRRRGATRERWRTLSWRATAPSPRGRHAPRSATAPSAPCTWEPSHPTSGPGCRTS